MFEEKISKEYLFSSKEIKMKKKFNLISDKNFKDDVTETKLKEKVIFYKKYKKWFLLIVKQFYIFFKNIKIN